jgi:hypothetical protein
VFVRGGRMSIDRDETDDSFDAAAAGLRPNGRVAG